jgi:hypothetical protein
MEFWKIPWTEDDFWSAMPYVVDSHSCIVIDHVFWNIGGVESTQFHIHHELFVP